MSHIEQQQFCLSIKNRFPNLFKDVKVLDIGSTNINGCNRPLFENSEYIGCDIMAGNNVDVISKGHELIYPDGTFDTIISTECFEHDMYFELTMKNAIRMLKSKGLFIWSAAGPTREIHGTLSHHPTTSPHTIQIEEWANYYKNITKDDVNRIINKNDFKIYEVEYIRNEQDIQFVGIKK